MGRLRRSGMIEARSGDNLAINLQLCRGGLRKLATARIRSVEELFGGFLVSAPPPTLRPDDYRHLSPGFEVLERSEEHTSELQSIMRISYAVFCLKKKNTNTT